LKFAFLSINPTSNLTNNNFQWFRSPCIWWFGFLFWFWSFPMCFAAVPNNVFIFLFIFILDRVFSSSALTSQHADSVLFWIIPWCYFFSVLFFVWFETYVCVCCILAWCFFCSFFFMNPIQSFQLAGSGWNHDFLLFFFFFSTRFDHFWLISPFFSIDSSHDFFLFFLLMFSVKSDLFSRYLFICTSNNTHWWVFLSWHSVCDGPE
jgi:hypothetical protein